MGANRVSLEFGQTDGKILPFKHLKKITFSDGKCFAIKQFILHPI